MDSSLNQIAISALKLTMAINDMIIVQWIVVQWMTPVVKTGGIQSRCLI